MTGPCPGEFAAGADFGRACIYSCVQRWLLLHDLLIILQRRGFIDGLLNTLINRANVLL